MTKSEARRKEWKEGRRKGGWKHTEQWRKEASQRMKGNKNGLGSKHTEAWKIQHAERLQGKNNPAWKGGVWKNNPQEYKKMKKRERRCREMKADGSFILAEWELLKKQYGYRCPSCKRKQPEIELEPDHIIPLIKGGSNYIENIQPLCRNCNSKKHTKIIKYHHKRSAK
jgi:5-methylcytosine-specific restriction endonuclease McrA